MTNLALHFSRYVNGVAMRHGEVSQDMFPQFPIHAIRMEYMRPRGHRPVSGLFDREIPEWRRDNAYMRYAVGIPLEEIKKAHACEIRAHQGSTPALRHAARRIRVDLGLRGAAATYSRADLSSRH